MPARVPRPDDHQCAGTYGAKYNKRPDMVGKPCECWIAPDKDFCTAHRPLADEDRCTGHLSKNHKTDPGGRCPCRAMKGQRVCGLHGGHTPAAKVAAKKRIDEAQLEARLTRTLARLQVTPVENPLTALSQLAGQVVAWQDALADRVNALSEIRYEDAKGGEQLRAEVALYERAMDRCNTVLGTIGRLNIDERLVAINERQARVVIDVIQAVLDFLGVTGEQATEAKKLAARKLRAVGS
jgi:hypothetical protein